MPLTAEQANINNFFHSYFKNEKGEDSCVKETAHLKFKDFVTESVARYKAYIKEYDEKLSFIQKLFVPRPTIEKLQKLLLMIAVFRLQMHNLSGDGKNSIISALDECEDMHQVTPRKWWHFGDDTSYIYITQGRTETITTSKIMFQFISEVRSGSQDSSHLVEFRPAFIKAIGLDENLLLWHNYAQKIKTISDFQQEAGILKDTYEREGYGRWYNRLLGKGNHQRKRLMIAAAASIDNQTTAQGAREVFNALAPYTFFTAGYSPQAIVQDFEKPSILNRLKLWLYTTSEMASIYNYLSRKIEKIKNAASQAKLEGEKNQSPTDGAAGNPYTKDALQQPDDSKGQQTSNNPQPKVTTTPTTSSTPAPANRVAPVDPNATQDGSGFVYR